MAYFANFGEVIDPIIMRDKESSIKHLNYNIILDISRGFGFLTFKDPEVLDFVLTLTPHCVDGKPVRIRLYMI